MVWDSVSCSHSENKLIPYYLGLYFRLNRRDLWSRLGSYKCIFHFIPIRNELSYARPEQMYFLRTQNVFCPYKLRCLIFVLRPQAIFAYAIYTWFLNIASTSNEIGSLCVKTELQHWYAIIHYTAYCRCSSVGSRHIMESQVC
jgi:hypothetical protein